MNESENCTMLEVRTNTDVAEGSCKQLGALAHWLVSVVVILTASSVLTVANLRLAPACCSKQEE